MKPKSKPPTPDEWIEHAARLLSQVRITGTWRVQGFGKCEQEALVPHDLEHDDVQWEVERDALIQELPR